MFDLYNILPCRYKNNSFFFICITTALKSVIMVHISVIYIIKGFEINRFLTSLLSFYAFPAILLYAQELLPNKLGLISGLFFGFAFGIAGIASAVLGDMADRFGIEAVYNVCAFMPLLGLVTWFLPNLKKA
jgi:MFS transporter, FSR family, fosmidomycin resistance protein